MFSCGYVCVHFGPESPVLGHFLVVLEGVMQLISELAPCSRDSMYDGHQSCVNNPVGNN